MRHVNGLWYSLDLFQELLDQWPDLVVRSQNLRSSDPEVPMTIRAAVIGFSLYYPMEGWSKANFEYVDGFLNGPMPLDLYSPTPECNESHRVFGCLCLGGLLGAFNAGGMKAEEATKGEWTLLAFLARNRQAICDGYKFAEAPLLKAE